MEIDETITISEYDPNWIRWYKEEVEQLQAVFGASARFEHFGSTSIPGMPAKPIVDILVGINGSPETDTTKPLEMGDSTIKELEGLGYECLGEASVPGRIYCRKRGIRSFNLAVTAYESGIWRDNLILRDYLLHHPSETKRYAEHKWSAFRQGNRTLLAYSDYKSDFVGNLLQRAKEHSEKDR